MVEFVKSIECRHCGRTIFFNKADHKFYNDPQFHDFHKEPNLLKDIYDEVKNLTKLTLEIQEQLAQK